MTRGAKIGLGVLGAAVLSIAASRALGSRPEDPSAHGPLAPCGAPPNCYHAQARLDAAPEAVRTAAREAVEMDGYWLTGHARSVDETASGLEAVFRIGSFEDDVAVAVEADGAGSVLTIRSASRVGRSDLGVNRMRVRHLVGAVRARLGA